MNEILALLEKSTRRLEEVRRDLDSIKEEDLSLLSGLADQIQKVEKDWSETDGKVRVMQNRFFGLVATCVSRIEDNSSFRVYVRRDRYEIDVSSPKQPTIHGDVPSLLTFEKFTAIMRSMLEAIKGYPIQAAARDEELKAKTSHLLEAKKDLLQFCQEENPGKG